MKATAHWLELKGHTPPSPSTLFDQEFTDQVIETGRIEEGRILRRFFARTGQALKQDWLIEMARRVARRMPVKLAFAMGKATLFRPRTRRWAKARTALTDYVHERESEHRKALGLGEPKAGGTGAADAARH